MRSLYKEETPKLLEKIEAGIKQRVEDTGPDETVGLLEFLYDKISNHKGEYIRISNIPVDMDKVDTEFLRDMLQFDSDRVEFFRHLLEQNWSDRFEDLLDEG